MQFLLKVFYILFTALMDCLGFWQFINIDYEHTTIRTKDNWTILVLNIPVFLFVVHFNSIELSSTILLV